MKTWLKGEHKYIQIVFEPKLRKQFEKGGMEDIRKFLWKQITDALGKEPTSMKWEQEKENIVIGAAI